MTKGYVEQMVAVLYPELGHWACSHTTLGLFSLPHLGAFCELHGFSAGNADLYCRFGYVNNRPNITGLLLLSETLTPVDAMLKSLGSELSRRFEYEVIRFKKDWGMVEPLTRALVAMHLNNLSNMVPDAVFAMGKYGHTTLLERLDALEIRLESLVNIWVRH